MPTSGRSRCFPVPSGSGPGSRGRARRRIFSAGLAPVGHRSAGAGDRRRRHRKGAPRRSRGAVDTRIPGCIRRLELSVAAVGRLERGRVAGPGRVAVAADRYLAVSILPWKGSSAREHSGEPIRRFGHAQSFAPALKTPLHNFAIPNTCCTASPQRDTRGPTAQRPEPAKVGRATLRRISGAALGSTTGS